jgi:ATP-dependent DNA ligase
VKLPLKPDYAPMEARVVAEVPEGDEWQYEPKWDGFRCLAFRDGETVDLRSKSGQPLARYFPEIVDAVRALKPKKFVIDGEIVVPIDGALSFDSLLQRIHPAQSRIDRLSTETPGQFVVFDLLVDGKGESIAQEPLTVRRPKLEAFAKSNFAKGARIVLSPSTKRIGDAREWLRGREGTDGVIAKRVDLPYATGERTGMVKIKRKRTVDCVVGGFRYASKGKVIGSLLLGLYDTDGLLHHVGFTSSFTAEQREAITPKVEKLRGGTGFTGRAPGGPSRWSTARSSEWEALKPKLVVEVEYDHYTAGRFRHGTKFLRWRPDKAPAQCVLSQVAEARAEKPTGSPAAKKVATKRDAPRARKSTRATTIPARSRPRKSSSSR